MCPACGILKTTNCPRKFWKRHLGCDKEAYTTARATARSFTCPSIRHDKVLLTREDRQRKSEIKEKKHGADWDVYRVEEHGEKYAVKESRRYECEDSTEAIRRETNCLHAIHSKAPFSLAVQLVGECKGRGVGHCTCLMVEWCEGPTLGSLVDRHHKILSETHKFLLVLRLAEFYKHLHKSGVEYRDGHSWNFMLASPFKPGVQTEMPLLKGTDFSRARSPLKYEEGLSNAEYPFDRREFNYYEFTDMIWFAR